MSLQIYSTTDNRPPRLRVAVYGATKVGKTTFAGTFPKPFFFVMGAETGISSLSQLENPADYVIINTVDDMMEAVTIFAAEYKARGWRTAVFDTATIYGRYCAMQESKYGTETVEFTGWMHVLGHFLNVRDVIHQCDVHVVWVMHDDEVKSGDVVVRREPKLVGAARKEVLQTCGLICYLDRVERGAEYADDGKTIVKPAETVRRLWVRCLEGTFPPFETGSWYENVLTEPCYKPTFARLAQELCPAEGKKHITI